MHKAIIILATITVMYACGTSKKPYYNSASKSWASTIKTSDNKQILSLFLIGDTGEIHEETKGHNYVLDAMSAHIKQTEGATSLVYLGDNIYPAGLPVKDDPARAHSENIIDVQIELANIINGSTYFIPGNHDWNRFSAGGLEAIKRQEEYIKSKNEDIKFFPKNGCGDPEVVLVNSDLVFVFIDSQWWLQDWALEKNINQGCGTKSREHFLQQMEEIFLAHQNNEIYLFMHHPIKSNGGHGGYFSIKHHIFPLHEKNIWLPLPIAGSIYPILRNVIGSEQDITNKFNQELTEGLTNMAKELDLNIVFVAGHEHGLQHFDESKIKYIVSGGGSKNDYARKGKNADYVRDGRGYALLNLYENSEAWVEYYTVSTPGQNPKLEYRALIRAPQ